MRYLLVFALLATTSCLPVGEKPLLQKACTLMGATSQYKVDLGDNPGLPAFVAVTSSSGTALADECDTSVTYSPVIYRFADHAYYVETAPHIVIGDIITDEIDFNYKPGLKLYGRASCGDPLQPIAENAAVSLQWSPVYVNGGPECGADAFAGEGHL